ncbi:MAG: outer membrane beta-barrel protein [Bacteroidales bacterium]|nr:outer membrane beta-barrel protein [Bacteroidales bacterium]
MKKRFLILAFLLAAVCIPARAQLFQMGLKVQYSSSSVDDMINNVTNEVQNFSTEFLKGCEAGLLLRVNVGRLITIQPEANFSIGSIWDSVDAQTDFIASAMTAFQNVQTVNLSVPVLAAVHLIDLEKLVDLRVFAGPEFYTTIKGATSDSGMDFSKYSLIAGVGVDLFDVLYVDARVARYSEGEMFYRLGVGLLF